MASQLSVPRRIVPSMIAAACFTLVGAARAEPGAPHAQPSSAQADSAAAHAEPGAPLVDAPGVDESDAHALRARAQIDFESGRYAEAARAFSRAFRLTAAPRDVFNQGTSLHWEGDCDGARQAFEEYLWLEDDEPHEREERRADALRALDHLNRQCPKARAEGGGVAPARAPQTDAHPSAAAPGGLGAPGGSMSMPTAAAPLEPNAGLPVAGVGASTGPVAGADALPDVLRWSALGTGAALAVAAVATGLAGRAAGADLEALGRNAAARAVRWDDCCRERAAELDAERRGYRTATAVLALASGVLVGTAAVLWTVDFETSGPSGTQLSSASLTYRSPF